MNSLVWFITGASRGFGLELGTDSLARVEAKLAVWRKLAESTDYEQASNARTA